MGLNLFHTYSDRKYILESENGGKNIGFHIKFCLKRDQITIFKDFPNLTLTET